VSRPVRVAATVGEDIGSQLDVDAADLFWRHDLVAALDLLSTDEVWDSLPAHGGGRRLTVKGITVGAFHLFVAVDALDPRADALVAYAVDINGPGVNSL